MLISNAIIGAWLNLNRKFNMLFCSKFSFYSRPILPLRGATPGASKRSFGRYV